MAKFKKWFDVVVWVVIFTTFAFAFLIYITKDSIPGDWLYGTKLGLEQVMIASSSIINQQVNLEIDFVARRYGEITKVLASKYGLESLKRLVSQVTETADSIKNIKDPAQRKEAAANYIVQLSYVSGGLQEEQQKIVYNTPSYTPPTSAANTNTPTNNQSISNQINNTQQTIKSTINEMTQIQNNTENWTMVPSPTPTDTPIPIPTLIPVRASNPTVTPGYTGLAANPTDTPGAESGGVAVEQQLSPTIPPVAPTTIPSPSPTPNGNAHNN